VSQITDRFPQPCRERLVSDITDTNRCCGYAKDAMLEARSHSQTTTADRLQRKEAPRLEVYVSSECLNCGEAVRLAEEAAARYPNVGVRVIDLDQDGSPPPDPIVAVPTYLLDGQVISLGNPYPEELFARLHEAVE